MTALRIITASLLLILISLSLRACAPPPRLPDSEPEYEEEDEEEDPRAALMRELHEIRTQTQLNHAQILFMRLDVESHALLDDVRPLSVAHLIQPLPPRPATPSLGLDREIRHIGLYPFKHEPRELISSRSRFRLFNLTDDLIVNEEDRFSAK